MDRQQPLDHLEQIVRDRVETGRSTGIVAGMVLPDGSTGVVAHGDADEGRGLDGDSVFEIGSVTKVFTATLLAEMVQRGEVRLGDPVAALLPAGVSVPSRAGRQITLEDLATQTSGLPRDATNFAPADLANPFASYGSDQLYEFLAGYELTRDPGARFDYSNLGVGLLGHALALRAGTSYEDLVRTRILQPLGMTSTAITPSADMQRRAAAGHDARGNVVAAWRWDQPTLAGAGALRSSVTDMLRFAAANLGGGGDSLHEAMAMTHAPRKKIALVTRIGLGWNVLGSRDRTMLLHGGATGGFFSFVGLRPAHSTAIVVLSNSRQSNVEDIGLHLLNRRVPLAPPPKQRREIALAPALLERCAGVYDVAGTKVRVTCSDDGLSVHAAGEPVDRLYAESRTKFFFKSMDAQVTMKLDHRRRVKGAVVHQYGARIPARKLDA